MVEKKKNWEPPQVQALGALPEGLGSCGGGSTVTLVQNCPGGNQATGTCGGGNTAQAKDTCTGGNNAARGGSDSLQEGWLFGRG